MKNILLITVVGITFCSCGNVAKLNMTLSSVDVSRDTSSILHILENDTLSFVLSYEDDIIRTKWNFGDSELILTLENLTDNTIKIIWDDAAFIGMNEIAGRIMHTGTSYLDRNDFQPPTIIPKKTKVIEYIVPTENIYFGSYGWIEGRLFIYHIDYLKKLIDNYTGKNIKLLIPIVIGDKKIEYIFNFKVKYVSKERMQLTRSVYSM